MDPRSACLTAYGTCCASTPARHSVRVISSRVTSLVRSSVPAGSPARHERSASVAFSGLTKCRYLNPPADRPHLREDVVS